MSAPSKQAVLLTQSHPVLFPHGAPENNWKYDVLPGWAALIDQLCSEIEASFEPDVLALMRVIRIKEKMGELRFVVTYDFDALSLRPDSEAIRSKVQSLIGGAMAAACYTCITCGLPGELKYHGGYLAPMCPSCAKKREESFRV